MRNRHWLTLGLLAAALGAPTAVHADAAKIAPGEAPDSAFRAFGTFARSWMAQMQEREGRNRRNPTIEHQGARAIATYTGYAPEWKVEVHATGDRTSPYVGVLQYEEHLYTCSDETTRQCRISRSTPVTEVFPYRDGSWKY